MKYLRSRLSDVFHDAHFLHVCVGVFSLAWIAGGCFIFVSIKPGNLLERFSLLFPVALVAYGVFLLYVSVLGSEEVFDRAARYVDPDASDIGGLILVVFVGVVAFPVTAIVRWVRQDARKAPGLN